HGVGRMAHDGVPSAFVVDTHATRPAVPPRLGKQKKHGGAAQTLLFILVALALLGVFFEAVFIYRLYQSEYVSVTPPPDTTDLEGRLPPSKPVAHLTGETSSFATSSNEMFNFSNQEQKSFSKHYKKLVIQKEGYYYIYSKVYFTLGGAFYHSVEMQTKKYAGKGIPLLQAREYSSKTDKGAKSFSNSFLAGVFYLYQNDAVYVHVSNTTQIMRHKSYENVFGAFMI
uniref:THD domain-containing protein n=1 Tax=Poecilia latipinna TaxID=48699 RepID=A0A3B3V1E0_9TELE